VGSSLKFCHHLFRPASIPGSPCVNWEISSLYRFARAWASGLAGSFLAATSCLSSMLTAPHKTFRLSLQAYFYFLQRKAQKLESQDLLKTQQVLVGIEAVPCLSMQRRQQQAHLVIVVQSAYRHRSFLCKLTGCIEMLIQGIASFLLRSIRGDVTSESSSLSMFEETMK
jgi:hypothetical protein